MKDILLKSSFKQLIIITSLSFVLVSLFIYQDYGISWDEQRQRDLAINNYDYVMNGEDGLESFRDKDYGIAFEMPLFLLERVLGLDDCREIYQFRHLISHWFFLLCAMAFAYLIYHLFDHKWLALIAFLCLCLHPRIYVHSFVNSKDIPFMGGVILFLFILKGFIQTPSNRKLLSLVLICAFVINLRIMGIVILLPVIAYFLFGPPNGQEKRQLMAFLLGVPICLFISWPYLWSDPISNFSSAISNLGNFRWDGSVLFMGDSYLATDKPWFYSLVWIGISTPALFLVFSGIGIVQSLRELWANRNQFFAPRSFIIATCLYLFIGTIIGIIVIGSDNFDGWRHLYYIYPCLIILVITGLHNMYKRSSFIKYIFPVYIIWLILNLVQLHPHQQTYFNELTPKSTQYLRSNYDMDYWGLSYKQGLEFIARNDNSRKIYVFVDNWPGRLNLCSLPLEDRQRIHITDTPLKANYFLTNYRFHPEDFVGLNEVHAIKTQGSTILSVFEL